MAQNLQILCVNKTDRSNPHERIQNIGGRNEDGTRWKLSQPAAIEGIESGKWAFYVALPGVSSVWVIVATHNGNKYIKTTADGLHPNNLLSLDECA